MNKLRYIIFVAFVTTLWLCVGGACTSARNSVNWNALAAGLELGTFVVADSSGDAVRVTVLRIDPQLWNLELRSRSESGAENDKSARQWCREPGVVAATNAGMFNTDYKAHIGYMQSGEHINNPHILRKKYHSAALFGPLSAGFPEFQIADLDEVDLDSLKQHYKYVIQNLRLIKFPGENRWEKKEKKWSEAALAEDSVGNALFVFSRQPLTMFAFNEALLSLPLGIVRAQHLEGGPEAQLYYQVGAQKGEFVGSFETGFSDNSNTAGWPIPNVIVVKKQ